MGQVLSLLICGTAVSCQYLADRGVETPVLQSFLNYALLLLVYTSVLCTRKGQSSCSCAPVKLFHSEMNGMNLLQPVHSAGLDAQLRLCDLVAWLLTVKLRCDAVRLST